MLVEPGEEPDLVWDAGTREVVSHLGDVVATDIRATALNGVIDKWRALTALKALAPDRRLALRIEPGDAVHRAGATVGLRIEGIRYPYYAVFSLSGDGTVHHLYPVRQRGDPLTVDIGKPISYAFQVTPPFGADHVVAVTSDRPLGSLYGLLERSNLRREAVAVTTTLARVLGGGKHQVGIQGLYTGP